jgi:hypothetical protein
VSGSRRWSERAKNEIRSRSDDGGLPLVEDLPDGLEGADNAFFEVGRVFLCDDDEYLEIFFVGLFCEMVSDEGVGVGFGGDMAIGVFCK